MAQALGKNALALRLGIRLRSIRELRGLSQTQVAERMGIGPGQISRAETAQRVPTLPTLIRVANALSVALADLLDLGDDARSPELTVMLADLRAASPELRAAALAVVQLYLNAVKAKPRRREAPSAQATSSRSGGGHGR